VFNNTSTQNDNFKQLFTVNWIRCRTKCFQLNDIEIKIRFHGLSCWNLNYQYNIFIKAGFCWLSLVSGCQSTYIKQLAENSETVCCLHSSWTYLKATLDCLIYVLVPNINIPNRIGPHLLSSGNFSEFQSAYRAGHSTETALLRVNNDLVCNIENQRNCFCSIF